MNVRLNPVRSIAAVTVGALLAGWLGLVGSPASAATSWQPAATLVDSPAGTAADYLRVTASSDGKKVTAVWMIQGEIQGQNVAYLQTRSSKDAGATWGQTQNLTPVDGTSYYPDLTASRDGNNVTVLYPAESPPGTVLIYSRSSRDAGATWGEPVLVGPGPDSTFLANVALAGSGDGSTLVGTWRDIYSGYVYASTSTNGGVAWNQPRQLNEDGVTGSDQDVSVSRNGAKAAVSWGAEVSPDTTRLVVATTGDSGANWTSPRAVSPPDQTRVNPGGLRMSSDGNELNLVWTSWDGVSTVTVSAASSSDSGGTWSTPTDLGTARGFFGLALAASANGARVFVVWGDNQSETSGILKVRTSGDGGGTWAPVVDLTSGTESVFPSAIQTSDDGTKATLVWTSDPPAFNAPSTKGPAVTHNPVAKATSTTDSGSTWETNTTLSESGQPALFPALAMSADGTSMIAVWQQSSGLFGPSAPRATNASVPLKYALGSLPTPVPPTPVKKTQKPANAKGKPPARIKRDGVTVITGRNARTNAGQLIRTRVRCVPLKASAAGETRYCTVIRGPEGKVSLRTYGKPVRVIVVQRAAPTAEYKRYVKRTVYVVR